MVTTADGAEHELTGGSICAASSAMHALILERLRAAG
jgi:hypothetical protein